MTPNEQTKKRITGVLRHVADNIDDYIPAEWLLNGSTFVVRIGDYDEFSTVELTGVMLAEPKVVRA